jgi:hypothetical protein
MMPSRPKATPAPFPFLATEPQVSRLRAIISTQIVERPLDPPHDEPTAAAGNGPSAFGAPDTVRFVSDDPLYLPGRRGFDLYGLG